MNEWVGTILLGVIEGVTEFLPVSSTGHLLLAEHWLGLKRSELFTVGIQSGALLAVLMIFGPRLRAMITGEQGRKGKQYLWKIGGAFLLTAALGLAASKLGLELSKNPAPVAWALLVGGVLILAAEWWLRHHQGKEDPGWGVALAIGISQILAAVFPGTSRSGATILAGMFCGLSRTSATDFSFLLGIPTLLAAAAYSFYKELKIAGVPGQEEWLHLGLGFAVSAVTAYFAVRWLIGYVRSNTFLPFAWYRIALGLIILLLVK
ncbi:MAG: undecaprenyl-diphosphate phosphatase [Verrucomicrobia bacterium]|nr:undecaprenyl-diphosphate phosphatase [Verrucomicrobiota bacterium]